MHVLTKLKATHYGQVELIPGIICDGYIINGETAALSERTTAHLLSMAPKTLNPARGNWPPQTLQPFIYKGGVVRGNYAQVIAKNSRHYGRNIIFYDSKSIETLIRTYALAFANGALRKNQEHIGKRAVELSVSLIQTALETSIKEACGLSVSIQKTAQKNHNDIVQLIKEFGFKCSVNKNIATKKDIANFLQTPQSTLNSFLYKHNEITPIKLDKQTIRSLGCKANRMNGYHINDVAKIALGMDTVVGIKLKEKMFGAIGVTTKVYPKNEIHWRKIILQIFEGFTIRFNYSIEKYRYRVDFYIVELSLCLECNGYYHRHYDPEEEKEREKTISQKYALVRFHHKTSIEKLCNGIMHAKRGKVIKLYDNTNLQIVT